MDFIPRGHHPLAVHSCSCIGNCLPVKHLDDVTRDFKALKPTNLSHRGLVGQIHSMVKDPPVCLIKDLVISTQGLGTAEAVCVSSDQ